VSLALYRKYRPRTFAEVIGQDHVTEPLMQAIRTGRLNHAYLFSGPRGCGKTSSARILARSLNCEKGPTPEPCGECDSCVALAPDGSGSIDVIEIDAASHGGVDDARDLRERAFFAPVASRFKVYIIDEAHMVSTQGFNALLKLVEEPPEYVKFIFATTEPEKVLGTIRSRTHHYPFRLIAPSVLRPYLEKLCKEEGVSVEPAVFPLVVRSGGGSARDSLSVLDQLIAGAGVDGVSYARAVALLGVTDAALIDEMTDALAAGDGAAAFTTIDRVAEAGHDSRRFASDLLEHLRDLIVLQRVPDAAKSGIIDAPDDQLERMTTQASRMGQATLSRLADIVHNGLTEMRGTTAPRLLLELIVARMLLPGAEDTHGALLQRLERMERRLGATSESAGAELDPPRAPVVAAPSASVRPQSTPERVRPAPVRAPAEPAPSTPAPPPPPVATAPPAAREPDPAHVDSPGSIDAAAVRRVWDEVLAVIRRRSPRAWAVVREGMVRDVHGEEIVLVFQHAVHANMFGAQAELLIEAMREVLGGSWRIRAELGGGDEAARPEPARATPARAEPAPAARTSTPTASRSAPPAQSPSQPARDTASRPARSEGTGLSGSGTVDDGGWPTPAALGGAGSSPASEPAPAAAPPVVPTARPAPTRSAPAKKARPLVTADSPPPDEPPFDPDYDSAPRTASYEGFDPGDEPLDDASTVRETSEEQAIRVLTETFGAEKIGEADRRT
jgi:DNA polymerase-3 subunit gamma/tau